MYYVRTYLRVCVCVCVCVCMNFFYWLCMLHYNCVILHAISCIVSYHGDVLCFTHFESPLSYMVFVIVGQNLLILKRLEMSPGASILGAVCLQASVRLLWHSSYSVFVFLVACSGREGGQPSGLLVRRRMLRVLES
jgi:hypothetical protein